MDSPITKLILWLYDAGSAVVWVIVALVLIYLIIYSAILVYHWKKFGVGKTLPRMTLLVFFGGSAVLIAAMLIAATLV